MTTYRGAHWCSRCEWGLDRFDPQRNERPFGWTWLDRLAHRTAYRLNARMCAALAGRP